MELIYFGLLCLRITTVVILKRKRMKCNKESEWHEMKDSVSTLSAEIDQVTWFKQLFIILIKSNTISQSVEGCELQSNLGRSQQVPVQFSFLNGV